MIELSFTKLLLVAVIALVVLGPEKLPKAARMAGAMLRRLRLGWDSVRSEVERELELEELKRAAKEAAGQADALRKAAEDNARAASVSANELRTEVLKDTGSDVQVLADSESDGAAPVQLELPDGLPASGTSEAVGEGVRDGDV